MPEQNPYQRTPEWYAERCGKLTASNAWKAFARLKSGAKGETYWSEVFRVAAERRTGKVESNFVTDAMLHGIETEPEARATYELETGCEVKLVGFVEHPTIAGLGASPDGLVGDDGLIEIKCPTQTVFTRWQFEDKVPEQHKPQMLLQCLCTGRRWCDFVAYCADCEESIFIKRFIPEAEELEKALTLAQEFLADVEIVLYKIKNRTAE